MTWPIKRYFSLGELTKRWDTDLENLRYHIEHDELAAICWLDQREVMIYQPNGEAIAGEQRLYEGYVGLYSRDCRKIFRCGGYRIMAFQYLEQEGMILSVMPHAREATISVDDIRITKQECRRFEEAYDIAESNRECKAQLLGSCMVLQEAAAPAFEHQPLQRSFSGRPSVMFKIEQELKRRAECGECEPSLARESEALYVWAQQHIHNAQIPKKNSIQNAIRHRYQQLKQVHEIGT